MNLVAAHESGHAVLALALDITVRSASLSVVTVTWPDPVSHLACAMCDLAGLLSEAVCGYPNRLDEAIATADDPQDDGWYYRYWRRRRPELAGTVPLTYAILTAHAGRLLDLAGLLARDGRLDGPGLAAWWEENAWQTRPASARLSGSMASPAAPGR